MQSKAVQGLAGLLPDWVTAHADTFGASVLLQVICSNLIDFIMLGLVFARFSAPFKRATSIRFSSVITINRHSSGYWALTFRCAWRQQQQQLVDGVGCPARDQKRHAAVQDAAAV